MKWEHKWAKIGSYFTEFVAFWAQIYPAIGGSDRKVAKFVNMGKFWRQEVKRWTMDQNSIKMASIFEQRENTLRDRVLTLKLENSFCIHIVQLEWV